MKTESPWLTQEVPLDALRAELLFCAPPNAPFPEDFYKAWRKRYPSKDQREELRKAWNEWLKKGALNHVFIPVVSATDAYCIPIVVEKGKASECFATFPKTENSAVRRLVDALFGAPAAPQPSCSGVAKACGIVARGSSWNLGFVCAMLHQLGWCFRPGPRPLHLVVSAAFDDQLLPGDLAIKAVENLDHKFKAAKARFGENLLFVCSGKLSAKDPCILNLEHGTPLPDALRCIFAAWAHASRQHLSLEEECVASQIRAPAGLKQLFEHRHTHNPRQPQDNLDLRILARIERLFAGGHDVLPECVSVTFKEAAVASQEDLCARIYEMAKWEVVDVNGGPIHKDENDIPQRISLYFSTLPSTLPEDKEYLDWMPFLKTLCDALISASIFPETFFNALLNCFNLGDYEEAKPPLWRILDAPIEHSQYALSSSLPECSASLFDLLFRIVFPLAFWDTRSTLDYNQTLRFFPSFKSPLAHRFPRIEQRRIVAWTVALWSSLCYLKSSKNKERKFLAIWEMAYTDAKLLTQTALVSLAALGTLKKQRIQEKAMNADCYHHLCVLSDCLRAQLLHDIDPDLPDFYQSFSTLSHVLTVLPRKQLVRTRFLVEWILILAQRLRLLHHLRHSANCDNAPLDDTQQETQKVLHQLLSHLPAETDSTAYGYAIAPLHNRLLSISLPHC